MIPHHRSQQPRHEHESQTQYRMVCAPPQPGSPGPPSSQKITEPALPASKRGRASPPAESAPAPSSAPAPGPDYEVWRVKGLARRRMVAFPTLQDALQDVRGRYGGRYDIRLPDGTWFSESRTIRLLRGQ